MTLKQLIKKLQKFDQDHPKKRFKVYIDTRAAKAKFNDVFEIVELTDMKVEYFEAGDGDGFGTDRYHETLCLS